MSEKENFALVRKPSSAVEKAAPGAKRILSVMVADTLTLVKKARSPRIVLVDDEEWLREMLEMAIRQCFKDANVLSFDNGDQAWQELLRVEPDLFITDICRPGLSGLKMLPLLAAKKVKFPILVMSGLATEKNVQGYAGSDLNYSFLRKPFTTATFHRELLNHLAGKVVDVLAQFSVGDVTAQFNLGVCYQDGFGLVRDHAEAAKWYRKAAEQNHAVAQFNLGRCYDYGQGVTEDHTEAFKWYLKAAEQGHVKAQDCVGTYYYVGRGVEENYSEAVKWLRGLKKQTLGINQLWLGTCYEEGKGVSRDYCEAYKFYKLAVEAAAAGDGSVSEVIFEQNLKPLISRMTKQEIAEGERRHKEFCSSED